MDAKMNYSYLQTDIGTLRLVSDGQHITQIDFENQYERSNYEDTRGDDVLEQCANELQEYFLGKRQNFSVGLAASGTVFQHSVWNALREIPYGELRSYTDIATLIGNSAAVRAVGAANGRNPIPIIVPCHRVIGSNGKLTGFAGGLEAKALLLEIEGALLPLSKR